MATVLSGIRPNDVTNLYEKFHVHYHTVPPGPICLQQIPQAEQRMRRPSLSLSRGYAACAHSLQGVKRIQLVPSTSMSVASIALVACGVGCVYGVGSVYSVGCVHSVSSAYRVDCSVTKRGMRRESIGKAIAVSLPTTSTAVRQEAVAN